MKDIVGIIPAAGEGKRIGLGCKALLPIKRFKTKSYKSQPLIHFILENMKSTGIKKVIIIQKDNEIEKKLGYDFSGMNLIYVYQKKKLGIAHAISLAEHLINDENILIILGDIFYLGDDIKDLMWWTQKELTKHNVDTIVGVQKVKDKDVIKKSYGVTQKYPEEYIEKPTNVKDLKPLLGLGLYGVSSNFFDYIKKTPKNPRTGEIEITDVLNQIPPDKRGYVKLKGFYRNINTKEDYGELK